MGDRFHPNFDPQRYLEGAAEPLQVPELEKLPPTDFAQVVLDAVSHMGRKRLPDGRWDQEKLRNCLAMAASYMVVDATLNSENGVHNWGTGFKHLIQLILSLHRIGELEPQTVALALRVCNECWSATDGWVNVQAAKEWVRDFGMKMRTITDEHNGIVRYKGVAVS